MTTSSTPDLRTICFFSSCTTATSSSVSVPVVDHRPGERVLRLERGEPERGLGQPLDAAVGRARSVSAPAAVLRSIIPSSSRPDLRLGRQREVDEGDQRLELRPGMPRRRRHQHQRPRHRARPCRTGRCPSAPAPAGCPAAARSVRRATGAGRAARRRSGRSARPPRSARRAASGCPGCRAGRARRSRSRSTRCRPAAAGVTWRAVADDRGDLGQQPDLLGGPDGQQREPGPDQPLQGRREVVGARPLLLIVLGARTARRRTGLLYERARRAGLRRDARSRHDGTGPDRGSGGTRWRKRPPPSIEPTDAGVLRLPRSAPGGRRRPVAGRHARAGLRAGVRPRSADRRASATAGCRPPQRYAETMRYLASWGFVVVAPNTQRSPLPSHAGMARDLSRRCGWSSHGQLGGGRVRGDG